MHHSGPLLMLVGLLLITHALLGVDGQGAAAAAAAVAAAVAASTAESPDPCQCTQLGLSGGVPVRDKVGCLPDSTSPGDYFCYVVDPLGCPLALPSIVFRGAGYRPCEPAIEANATNFKSVLDVLANVPEIHLFNETIGKLGLVSQLLTALPDGVTIFAPTDNAIQMFLDIFGWNTTQALDSGEIPAIVLYHIVPRIVPSWLIASAPAPVALPTLSPAAYNAITVGESSVVNVSAGAVVGVEPVLAVAEPVFDASSPTLLGVPTGFGALILESYSAGDGVVHVIDHVLEYPPNVLQLLGQEPELSTFLTALNATGIAEQLDPGCPNPNKIDCSPNPVTLFAPTNAAFSNLAAQLGTTVGGLLSLPELTDILLYHITDPSKLTVPLAVTDGDLDNAVIPVLFENGTVVSGVQQRQVPIVQAPVAAPPPAAEAAPAAEPETQLVDPRIAALLGIGAPSRIIPTLEVLVEYRALAGQQNTAEVLPDFTLKGYNGAVNGIDTVLLPPGIGLPVSPLAAAAPPQGEAALPIAEGGAPAAEPVIVEPILL